MPSFLFVFVMEVLYVDVWVVEGLGLRIVKNQSYEDDEYWKDYKVVFEVIVERSYHYLSLLIDTLGTSKLARLPQTVHFKHLVPTAWPTMKGQQFGMWMKLA